MRRKISKKITAIVDVEIYHKGKPVAYHQLSVKYIKERANNLLGEIQDHIKEVRVDYGANLAFQKGWVDAGWSKAEIYLPWEGFNDFYHDGKTFYVLNRMHYQYNAEQIASEIHPVWDRLSRGAKALHTRNVYQVLGQELDEPSSFLICYAKPTKTGVSGGTNTAVQIANKFDTPVFNLYDPIVVERFEKYVS